MTFFHLSEMITSDSFKIGYITRTRGLKGEVQIFFEFDDPDALDLSLIFVEISRQLVPFFVSSYKLLSNNTGFFFLEDIDHIDQAKDLVRKSVFLSNDKMPVPEEGEFFIEDFKGFHVTDSVHGALGEILEINEYPQQYIASVNFRGKEILFPLSDDFIDEYDEEKMTLNVSLPEGLLDIYLDQP